ncbi:uncharacterized protein LOC121386537 [Gigantopelta aegis]|uniref:uncharacterized protein LOC121386537 n=1 Tax=Gigantopelta aegis TaxID=1735272 RepID=UPI001B88BD1D|nr:uncharacterized protein LOC121386537 [Gigantopelta aegis]
MQTRNMKFIVESVIVFAFMLTVKHATVPAAANDAGGTCAYTVFPDLAVPSYVRHLSMDEGQDFESCKAYCDRTPKCNSFDFSHTRYAFCYTYSPDVRDDLRKYSNYSYYEKHCGQQVITSIDCVEPGIEGQKTKLKCRINGTVRSGIIWVGPLDKETVRCNDLQTECLTSSEVSGRYTGEIDSPQENTLIIESFDPNTDAGTWSCYDGWGAPRSYCQKLSATDETCAYTEFPGRVAMGYEHVLSRREGQEFESCKAYCESDLKCTSFAFSHSISGFCYTYSGDVADERAMYRNYSHYEKHCAPAAATGVPAEDHDVPAAEGGEAETCAYTEFPNLAVIATVSYLSLHTDQYFESCKADCDSDPRCTSFDYKQSFCFTYSGDVRDQLIKYNDYNHYEKHCADKTCAYTKFPGFVAMGYDRVLSRREGEDFESCKAYCKNNPMCTSFDFSHSRYGSCSTYSYADKLRKDPNYSHYEKYCPPAAAKGGA